jgi:hypothetical protein
MLVVSDTCSKPGNRRRNYWVHALWMLNLLLLTALIWFVAYRWRENTHWPFLLFVWLMLAPIIFYLIASLLFPRSRRGRADHLLADLLFRSQTRDLFALVFPIDLIDNALKGFEHFCAQGPLYAATMIMWFVLRIVAAFTKRRRFHGWFAVIFLIYNLAFAGMQLITA